MSLSDLAKLESKNLHLKSEVSFENDLILRDIVLRHSPDKKHILIQTPNIYLPFGLSHQYGNDDRYLLKASFLPKNDRHNTYRHDIDKFESLIQEKLTNYKPFEFLSSIKQGEDLFYSPSMTIKIHPHIKPQIKDVYGQIQKLSTIYPGSWITMVICPKHVWIKDNVIGITWYLLEARVRSPIPILQRNLLEIQEQEDDETLCSICYQKILKTDGFSMNSQPNQRPPLPPEFQKYAKMLKLGIPLLAVIQKCQMDGKDPEILRSHNRNVTASHTHTISTSYTPPNPPPPPLPPPPPKNNTKASSTPRLLVSVDDLKNGLASLGRNKLNKKIPIGNKVIILKKGDPRVPSLEMIQESLNQLRKTCDFSTLP